MDSEAAPPTIRDVTRALEEWAPPGSAQSYDNVGLQVGDAGRVLQRGLVALDLTPRVISEAQERDANLIITHHPLLFRPLESVTSSSWTGGLALQLAEAGIALYSIHTNLDAAPGGVSFALAEQLGLSDVRFLDGFPESLYKLTVFVPADHLEPVRQALAEAGAGRIGDYEACAFATEGTGYFKPGDATTPFIGEAGGPLEKAPECRLEAEVARWSLNPVLGALQKAHPYEEVAYDLYSVEQKNTRAGLGALGRLEKPEPLAAFLERTAQCLDAESLRYAGNDEAPVQTVAVCGGAGSDFIGQALQAEADVYLTADVTYHSFFEVLDEEGRARMALVDAGHYETEAVTEQLLVDWLREEFAAVDWLRTQTCTSPVDTYVP